MCLEMAGESNPGTEVPPTHSEDVGAGVGGWGGGSRGCSNAMTGVQVIRGKELITKSEFHPITTMFFQGFTSAVTVLQAISGFLV